MRPVRVVGRDWVVYTQIGPDPIDGAMLSIQTDVKKAKRLILTCHNSRVEELREAVRTVSEDPDVCPDGEEFDRIMQVYLRTPV